MSVTSTSSLSSLALGLFQVHRLALTFTSLSCGASREPRISQIVNIKSHSTAKYELIFSCTTCMESRRIMRSDPFIKMLLKLFRCSV
ncbi:hypothetical protein F4678DRAFT_362248 [Xylaria arbuscula]|nr:hypothetical protein F4678DRAFT_362248 [Xylaria arbuscula]